MFREGILSAPPAPNIFPKGRKNKKKIAKNHKINMKASTTTAAAAPARHRRQRSQIRRAPSSFALLLLHLLVVGLLSVMIAHNDDRGGVALLASASSIDAHSAGAGGVIALNSKNFDSSLRDGKAWLIEFYAPW